MARPKIVKRVCREPQFTSFAPDRKKSKKAVVNLTVDEYEAIRLVDLMGCSREECAIHLNTARTTAQALYNQAKAKVAEAMVYGKELRIGGGTYTLCDGSLNCENCWKKNECNS